MLSTNPAMLQSMLQQIEQATLDHAVWRDHVLGVLSGRRPCDPDDVEPDAYLRCRFGRWYSHGALPEFRELPSFAMIGAEHENQHRLAARLLKGLVPGAAIEGRDVEEFEEASSRLGFALYFVRREIECAIRSRDVVTDAHSSWDMLRDLREWHALARQPRRQCCLAVMELDDLPAINAAHGYHVGAQAVIGAVRLVSAQIRPADKVFRYDGNTFLVRLSETDLAAAKVMLTRLREIIGQKLAPLGADGTAFRASASFGVALLDPDVDVLESVDRAHQALVLAKTAGRSQMICWDPSITTGVRLRRLEIKDVQE